MDNDNYILHETLSWHTAGTQKAQGLRKAYLQKLELWWYCLPRHRSMKWYSNLPPSSRALEQSGYESTANLLQALCSIFRCGAHQALADATDRLDSVLQMGFQPQFDHF